MLCDTMHLGQSPTEHKGQYRDLGRSLHIVFVLETACRTTKFFDVVLIPCLHIGQQLHFPTQALQKVWPQFRTTGKCVSEYRLQHIEQVVISILFENIVLYS